MLIRNILSIAMAMSIKDPVAFLRALFLVRHARHPKRSLDAGCGMGGITFVLALRSSQVVGINMNRKDIERAIIRSSRLHISNVTFLVNDLRQFEKIGHTLGTFDLICVFEVIEHVLDDAGLVRQLVSSLATNGRMMITTPHLGAKLFPGDRISASEDGGHLRWGYTREDIERLCHITGLSPEHVETFAGPVTYALGCLQRSCAGSRITRIVAQFLLYVLRPLQLLDPLFIRMFSYVPYEIGVVAKKG